MLKNEGLEARIQAQNEQMLALQQLNLKLANDLQDSQRKVVKLEGTVQLFTQDVTSESKTETWTPAQKLCLDKHSLALTSIGKKVRTEQYLRLACRDAAGSGDAGHDGDEVAA